MRYFIIFYFWADDKFQGYGEIVMNKESFPNRYDILAEISRQGRADIKAVTNIYEFKNKKDCDKYRGKEKHE